jgi:hypothetical protein
VTSGDDSGLAFSVEEARRYLVPTDRVELASAEARR